MRACALARESITRRAGHLSGAILAAVGLLLTACAADEGDAAGTESETVDGQFPVGMRASEADGEPVEGGELRVGLVTEPAQLDPSRGPIGGGANGLELAAIYDVLLRLDENGEETVPHLAESMEPSADFATWTLTLREGVSFTDGSPLNAETVLASIDRYLESGGSDAQVYDGAVERAEAVDSHTVEFTLAEPWAEFDVLFASSLGMVTAPDVGQEEDFTPIGAGPFELEHHAQGEEIRLARNDEYWGGTPNLDRLTFVYMPSGGTRVDSLENGALDVALIFAWDRVERLLNDDRSGFLGLSSLGLVQIINAEDGNPGEDPRVRRAMQHAIDPGVAINREFGVEGPASSSVWAPGARWETETEGLAYAPEAAEELLNEAMEDGYDGSLDMLTVTARQDLTLAAEAMLEAVGFEVDVETLETGGALVSRVMVDRDFDVAQWGLTLRGRAAPYPSMFSALHSEGSQQFGQPSSDALDDLVGQVRGSESEEEKQQVMEDVQEEWNELVPALVYGPEVTYFPWQDDLHDVRLAGNDILLFDQAWISEQ